MPQVMSLDHLVLTVRDMHETVAFYSDVLGMEAVVFQPATGGAPRHALRFGGQKINLHQAGREFEPKAAQPTPGSADLCFLTDTPLDAWKAHLERRNVAIEEGPVQRSGAVGSIMSLYIRDPDGALIEIATPA